MLFRGFMKYEAVNGTINNRFFSRKAFETDRMVCDDVRSGPGQSPLV